MDPKYMNVLGVKRPTLVEKKATKKAAAVAATRFKGQVATSRFVVRWEMKSVRRSSKRARGQVGMERFESQECIVRVALQASEEARREGRGS